MRMWRALALAPITLACATTRWTPRPDDARSDEIAASLAGRSAVLTLTAPASTRTRTELEMEIERADAFAIQGETASGVLRSVPVSDVRSISYATDRLLTAIIGGAVGACALGAVGYATWSSNDDSSIRSTGTALGALTGLVVGALLGALVGRPVIVSVEPPPRGSTPARH